MASEKAERAPARRPSVPLNPQPQANTQSRPWQARCARVLRQLATTVVDTTVACGLLLAVIACAWVMLVARLVAGFAGRRGVV